MNDGNAKEDGGFFVCFDRRTKGYKVFNSNQHRSKEHWKNLCAGVKTELTNNRNTQTWCEICSKLTIKTPERCRGITELNCCKVKCETPTPNRFVISLYFSNSYILPLINVSEICASISLSWGNQNISTGSKVRLNDALRDLAQFVLFKNLKNTHEGKLLLENCRSKLAITLK